MDADAIAILLVAFITLATFGAVANSVASPTVDGARYELPAATERLLVHPASSVGATPPSMLEVYGVEADFSGNRGLLPPVTAVIVLGLWSLIAMRSMGPPAVVFMLLTGGILLAILFLVGQGGTPSAVAPANQPVTLLDKLAMLLVGIVTVLSAVALFLPDDADAYTTDVHVLRTVRSAVSDLLGWRPAQAPSTVTNAPDNEVFRAWSAFAHRFGSEGTEASPTSQTPGEIADRALRAGAPTEDVRELRRVFERVRYGGDRPTERLGDRAVDAWRRIDVRELDE